MAFGTFNVALKDRAQVLEPVDVVENKYGHKHPGNYRLTHSDHPIRLYKIEGEFDRTGFEKSENWVIGSCMAILSLESTITDNAIFPLIHSRSGKVIFQNAKIRRRVNELNHIILYLIGEIPLNTGDTDFIRLVYNGDGLIYAGDLILMYPEDN